jgi:hypothetical protein
MKTFTAQVKEWTEKARRNRQLVLRLAVQKLVRQLLENVGKGAGQTPFLTGNLRRSLLASTSSLPAVRKDVEFKGDNSGQIALTIATWDTGSPLWLGFQAAYGMRLEYGFTGTDSAGRSYNQAGRYFVRAAVNNWQNYVNEAAKEIGK